MAANGDLQEALPIFHSVFKINRDWAETIQRLPTAGFFPDDKEMLDKILQELDK